MMIGDPDRPRFKRDTYLWSNRALRELLNEPGTAIFDTRHTLGVSLSRYDLTETTLPFELQLLESIGLDMVADAFVNGSGRYPLLAERFSPVYERTGWFPLLPSLLRRYSKDVLLVAWRPSAFVYWLEDRSIGSAELLANRSPLSWAKFAQRAEFTLNATDPEEDDYEELQSWGHSLEGISLSASNRSIALEAQAAATVVVRGDVSPKSPLPAATSPSHDRELWEAVGKGPIWDDVDDRHHRDEGIFLGPAFVTDPQLEADLVRAALALRGDRQEWVALTAYRHVESDDTAQEHLAKAWHDVVGGALPRSPRSAGAVATKLAANHAELRRLVKKRQGSPSAAKSKRRRR